MSNITIEEFITLKNSSESFQLIDVREPYEFEAYNIGGELIPLGEIPHRTESIKREKKVILCCKSGTRSAKVLKWLQKNHTFNNLYSLQGGIQAWIEKEDPAVAEKYL